jgi:hypothetical protein|tara:strand:- start:676 stop:777 length:102 start_codon:yes stop_codon:yes gene_type:complete
MANLEAKVVLVATVTLGARVQRADLMVKVVSVN